MTRSLLGIALTLLLVLHTDWWLWNDGRMFLGLPVGLTYHVGYCVVATLVLALVVRFAWPVGADDDTGGGAEP